MTAPSSATSFDLIVIGSGPAGQRAALQGAKAGKKVALIEAYPALGGGCVHFGTLPSKSFRESVYRYSLSSRGVLGKESDENVSRKSVLMPEMKRLLKRKERVVEGETEVITEQIGRNHITCFHGVARFTGAHEVEVVLSETPKLKSKKKSSKKGKSSAKAPKTITLRGEKIIIGTGARPVAPDHLATDGKTILDSNTVLDLKRVPKTMVVLGAGIIGCEYASMFSMAGTKVILVDRRPQILASVDREIVKHLSDRFEYQGMEIHLGTEATRLEKKKSGSKSKVVVHLASGKKISCDVVLVALGRCGNTGELQLDRVGIPADDRGLLKVDEHFRTNVPHIYAVGDVIGAPALASTSMEQGRIACCHAFNIRMKTDTNAVVDEQQMPVLYPYGIYTIPEISMIGRTEEELKAAGIDYVAGKARYKELARGQIVGDRWGLLKLLVDRKTFKLLGVHIVGDNAADLIHIGQAVMAFGGDVTYFINSVFNYPTLAEAYKTAAFHAFNRIYGKTRTA